MFFRSVKFANIVMIVTALALCICACAPSYTNLALAGNQGYDSLAVYKSL